MDKKKLLKSAKKGRKVSKGRDSIVLVLLSAHANRAGVFRMQDFLYREFAIHTEVSSPPCFNIILHYKIFTVVKY